MAFFALQNVTKRFGGLTAVNDLSFELAQGDVVAMIGPNGAGKSTVFNLITGVYEPTSGSIEFDGQPIAGRKTFEVASLGIARTFQNIRLFAFMSAIDNIMTGEHPRMKANLVDSLLHTPRQRREEVHVREKARELLAFVNLERDANTYARNLAYGLQRRLEIRAGTRIGTEAAAAGRAGGRHESSREGRSRGLDRPDPGARA